MSSAPQPLSLPFRPAPAALACCVLTLLSLPSCNREKPKPAPPAPTVSVARPVRQQISDWDEYPGRLSAIETVDVRPRVTGYIETAPFNEGAVVQQGDLLFTIDVRPFQADLLRAQGDLARAEAQERFAASEVARYEKVRATGAASETEYFNAVATRDAAAATVVSARAAVETARLNVEWCRVTAPIHGRVGRKLITPGNLVTGGTGAATLLTTIATLNPIYCYIEVDERTVRKYQRLVRENQRESAREGRLTAQLALTDEPTFTREGHIDFVDNRVDPTTGTITARGVFDNPNRELLPGFYARLRIPARAPYPALLVPEAAIGSNLAQQYVLVVDAENTVRLKPVTLGSTHQGLRVVEGIDADDRVVVNGIANARPGAKVQVQEVSAQQATTQAATQPDDHAVRAGQGPSRSNNGPAGVDAGTSGTGGAPGAGGAGAGSAGGGATGTGGAGAGGGGSR